MGESRESGEGQAGLSPRNAAGGTERPAPSPPIVVTMSDPQWPAEVVRVSYTPAGLRLHFPALRGWRNALRLALMGGAMLLLALYAAVVYSVPGKSDAVALLTLAMTAVVVYPVILFGALFVLVALYAVANSLTVEVSAASISCERRFLGFKYSKRSLPTAVITGFEAEARGAPRVLGGAILYRLIAMHTQFPHRLVVAEGIPDESLCGALKALIERHAQIDGASR